MARETQVCKDCGLCVGLESFGVDNSRPNGKLARCKDCIKVRNGKRDKEAMRRQAAEWRANNPEKVKAQQADWYARNAEKKRTYVKAYKSANRTHYTLLENKRRTVTKSGDLTVAEWDLICEAFGDQCLSCGRTDLPLTVDHVIPVSKGGMHTASNVQPLCMPCNAHKHTSIIDFRKVAI